jgi:predicted GNAT family acetyltransferase
VAGTHVVSDNNGVAALGTGYTHQEFRNQGYAKEVSSAVSESRIQRGIKTIVL